MIQTLFLLSLSSGIDPTAYARVVDAHLSVQTAQGKPLYRYALPKLPSNAALDEVMIDRSTKRCAALFENNDLKWFVLWARPGAPPQTHSNWLWSPCNSVDSRHGMGLQRR